MGRCLRSIFEQTVSASEVICLLDLEDFLLPNDIKTPCLLRPDQPRGLEAVGGVKASSSAHEDDDLFSQIFLKRYSNQFVDRAVTVWCIHTERISRGMLMTRGRCRYLRKPTEESRRSAQSNLATIRYAQWSNLVTLYRVLGGGFADSREQ